MYLFSWIDRDSNVKFALLEQFQDKWTPVIVKELRQNKELARVPFKRLGLNDKNSRQIKELVRVPFKRLGLNDKNSRQIKELEKNFDSIRTNFALEPNFVSIKIEYALKEGLS